MNKQIWNTASVVVTNNYKVDRIVDVEKKCVLEFPEMSGPLYSFNFSLSDRK